MRDKRRLAALQAVACFPGLNKHYALSRSVSH
jgi:hypothetical protein